MELWIIYAILWAIWTGMYGVCQKIETESGIVDRAAFLFYPYAVGIVWLSIVMYIYNIPLIFDLQLMLMWASVAILYTLVLKMRYFCLDYMSSSSYFINYRILISIGLIFVGTFGFHEAITLREYMWIWLGFIIFYLLIEKKSSQETLSDLKKWYVFLWISVLFAVLIWVIQKQVTFSTQDIWSFIFYNTVVGMVMSFALWVKRGYKKMLRIPHLQAALFIWVTSSFFVISYFFHLYTLYAGWDVAIAYKIISYGMILPILFSIIYYKEPVNWKKLLAFALTIVSIGLFI